MSTLTAISVNIAASRPSGQCLIKDTSNSMKKNNASQYLARIVHSLDDSNINCSCVQPFLLTYYMALQTLDDLQIGPNYINLKIYHVLHGTPV